MNGSRSCHILNSNTNNEAMEDKKSAGKYITHPIKVATKLSKLFCFWINPLFEKKRTKHIKEQD